MTSLPGFSLKWHHTVTIFKKLFLPFLPIGLLVRNACWRQEVCYSWAHSSPSAVYTYRNLLHTLSVQISGSGTNRYFSIQCNTAFRGLDTWAGLIKWGKKRTETGMSGNDWRDKYACLLWTACFPSMVSLEPLRVIPHDVWPILPYCPAIHQWQ